MTVSHDERIGESKPSQEALKRSQSDFDAKSDRGEQEPKKEVLGAYGGFKEGGNPSVITQEEIRAGVERAKEQFENHKQSIAQESTRQQKLEQERQREQSIANQSKIRRGRSR